MLNNNIYVFFISKIFAEKKYMYYLCKRKQKQNNKFNTLEL